MTEQDKCKCGHDGSPMHTCPYKEDVNDDKESLCNCCRVCELNCRDDI